VWVSRENGGGILLKGVQPSCGKEGPNTFSTQGKEDNLIYFHERASKGRKETETPIRNDDAEKAGGSPGMALTKPFL